MFVRSFNSDESQTDLLDRICDKGIVIAPWARVSMMEADRVLVHRCQVTSLSTFRDNDDDDSPLAA